MPPCVVGDDRYDGTQMLSPHHANIVAAFIAVRNIAMRNGNFAITRSWRPAPGTCCLSHISRLFHAAPDPEREQRREDADEEHRAPSEARQHDRHDDRRQAVADRPAALHDAERLAAMLLRPRLADQRRAARPLAAHAEAEQHAEDRELPEVLREAACEREDRIEQDAERQRARASELVGDHAEDQSADRRRGQRQRRHQPALRRRQPEVLDHRRSGSSA